MDQGTERSWMLQTLKWMALGLQATIVGTFLSIGWGPRGTLLGGALVFVGTLTTLVAFVVGD